MKLKQIRVSGYKNLIDCSVDLGDFNVLVGPNNSGKSNLLEAMQMLNGIMVVGSTRAPDSVQSYILRLLEHSRCHLSKFSSKPVTIGIRFEMEIKGARWKVDYEVRVEVSKNKLEFLRERLFGKDLSKRGPVSVYLKRDNTKVKIKGKEYPIAKYQSAFSLVSTVYPEMKGLSKELGLMFSHVIASTLFSSVAISPYNVKKSVNTEKGPDDFRISSFDPLVLIDHIKTDTKHYPVFRETVCNILDLEDIYFDVIEMSPPSKSKSKENVKRHRRLMLKTHGSDYADLEEFSDGTIAVVSILSVLIAPVFMGPVLLLEEPENFLHPAALERLLKFLKDNSDRWPVLITTHSPYLLNGVNPTDVNVAVVDETGATHFEKVKNTRELREYLNKGLMSFGDLLVNNYDRFRE